MDFNKNKFDYLSRPSTSKTEISDSTTRMSGISKLDSSFLRRKITSNNSYTDYAYREAMNRLKNLLSEPYTPSAQLTTIYQRPIYESSFTASDTSHHDHHTFPGRPSLKELSKYFPGTNIVRATCYTTPNHSSDKPLIHELPSGSCNVPSSSHHGPISSSNDANHQELLRFIERQENYIKQMERESDTNREELSSLKFKVQELMHENENLQRMDSDSERDFGKSSTVVMLESKVADLEAKLSQEKLDVKRLKEENENLRSKIATGAGLEIVETYKRKCDDLMREKNRLQDDVKRLEHKIEHMRTYESNLYSKNLRDRDYGEKTFDKSQLEIEVRRLKEDLDYQKDRYESLQQEMNRRIAEEREAALRGCTHHKFDHHTSSDDIGAKWEYTSKLQFEIDRHKRVEADLKREISQKNLMIDDLKAEYRHKIKNFQSELNELNAIRDTLESENNHLKLQLERQDRQAQVEATRLNNETATLRSRLDRADSDLMHARREQLRLNEQISALEKELAISDATRDTNNRPELSRIISDMEHKHGSTPSKARQRRESVSASQMHAKRSMKALEEAATMTTSTITTTPASRKRSVIATTHPSLTAKESFSETEIVTSTPATLTIVQHTIQEVQTEPLPPQTIPQSSQTDVETISMEEKLARKQRLEARTRELFNQLSLPLPAGSEMQGMTTSDVGPFMTLPCKLKVNIRIAPKELASSKTKNSHDETDDEVVVAEIIEETVTTEHPTISSSSALVEQADQDTA